MKGSQEIEDFLKGNNYFSGLDAHSRKALADICLIKELRKNDILFSEGQKGFGFFLLVQGAINVTRVTEEGKEMMVKLLRPGEVFGEVVLFEKKEYPAQAKAMTSSLVIIIPRQQIFCLLEDESFRVAFLGLLMNKLRYLTERMLYLTSHDVEERFFLFLKEHFGNHQTYDITITKKDFAQAIGTNPETFSRLLGRLEREGRITWRGHHLAVLLFF